DDGVERALEARHDVARKQLVGAQRALAIGPLMGTEQHAAETAVGIAEQALDALGYRLGRADQGGALLDALAQRVVGAAGWTTERVLEIGHRLAALAGMNLAQRLLVVVRHV